MIVSAAVTKVMAYTIGFLLMVCSGMAALSIYRGEIIKRQQLELSVKEMPDVQVILDTQGIADMVSVGVQRDIAKLNTSKETITNEIREIVKEPIYLSTTCFDAAGLSAINKAVASANSQPASQPSSTVQTDSAVK